MADYICSEDVHIGDWLELTDDGKVRPGRAQNYPARYVGVASEEFHKGDTLEMTHPIPIWRNGEVVIEDNS